MLTRMTERPTNVRDGAAHDQFDYEHEHEE